MATHSSVLAWRIPGMEEPGGLLSMGSHRVRHDWSDLAAAALIHAKTCRMGSLTCVLLKPPEASHLVAEDTLGESVSPWTLKPAFLVQIPWEGQSSVSLSPSFLRACDKRIYAKGSPWGFNEWIHKAQCLIHSQPQASPLIALFMWKEPKAGG